MFTCYMMVYVLWSANTGRFEYGEYSSGCWLTHHDCMRAGAMVINGAHKFDRMYGRQKAPRHYTGFHCEEEELGLIPLDGGQDL